MICGVARRVLERLRSRVLEQHLRAAADRDQLVAQLVADLGGHLALRRHALVAQDLLLGAA